jgi:hypothetical protein
MEIDLVADWTDALRDLPEITQENLTVLSDKATQLGQYEALAAATNFLLRGKGRSVFLQDADSLHIGSAPVLRILKRLRQRLPGLDRITTYARADTVAALSQAEMDALSEAGLNRIHIGMESGSNAVLELVHKGTTQAQIIEAGHKVKKACIELSVYIMPGLGGSALSELNADETALTINAINPDFIRVRTFTIPRPDNILGKMAARGEFIPLGDVGKARELARTIRGLSATITSTIYSDHVLNLLEEIHGRLPHDQARMLETLGRFLDLPASEQQLFIIGRRSMIMRLLSDLTKPGLRRQAEAMRDRYNIHGESFDEKIQELMMQFI